MFAALHILYWSAALAAEGNEMKRTLSIFLAIVATYLAGAPAHAGLMIELVNVTPSGANFSHNYAVHFSTSPLQERVEGGPVIVVGEAGSPDFVTIYDVGLIGGVSTFHGATAPVGWAVQTSNSGVNGPRTTPADNTAFTNVTFRYTGPTLVADAVIPGFSIISSFSGSTLDNYTSQRTDALGPDAGSKTGEIGFVSVPAIPEPASLSVVALMLTALTLYRRRK